MKLILATLTAILITSVLSAKDAANEKQAKEATEYRQAIFQLIKSNVGALGGMVRNKIPFNNDVVKTNSLRIYQLSQMVPDYFEIDTSNFSVDTEALTKIWDNKTDFNDKAMALQMASAKLLETAEAGNDAETKKAIGGVFRTCKGCHDEYKKD